MYWAEMNAARCIRLHASHTIDAIEGNVKSLMEMLTDNLSKLRVLSETLAAEKCALQDDRARLQSRLQAFVFLCACVFVQLPVVMDQDRCNRFIERHGHETNRSY